MERTTDPPRNVMSDARKEDAAAPIRLSWWLQSVKSLLQPQPSTDLNREISMLRAVLADLRQEIQSVRERERLAQHLAFHDDLTALPNRRCFRERLEDALHPGGNDPPIVAVIYIDLVGFKAFNDTHGHDGGDRLLTLVATRLRHALRAGDVVGRLGGDEFACLITGVSSHARLHAMATTLFDAISASFNTGSLAMTVHPSIGLAVYPSNGVTTDALLKAADGAMYQAKRQKLPYAFAAAVQQSAQ